MIINTLLTKIFGSVHEREIKSLRPLVEQIAQREPALLVLDDLALQKTALDLREKVRQEGFQDTHLIEAFALCREAADRRLGMMNTLQPQFNFDLSRFSTHSELAQSTRAQIESGTPLQKIMLPASFYKEVREIFPESRYPFRMRCFDVQLMGGMILHKGCIAEMKTGEGKTLVATLAVYLNALSGKGVHVVTTNDYLARVGANDNRPLYEFLGLSVGVIIPGLREEQRRESYSADVTYGTNNEFGFDYLRDNMARDFEDCVQRELNYAIVDEVDSILIDEARTPLIISGPAEDSTDKYVVCDKVVRQMKADTHYTSDEKTKQASLTEEGVNLCESQLHLDNLYGDVNTEWVHHIQQALRAHVFYKRDVDYVIRDREVIIVDEFTGRLMEGRRYGEGLHQAIEAKEKVPIARENQTLATITFQNYFRMYSKLAGMTGTADTEATEFQQIYNLRVIVVPTNRPLVRIDGNDIIYRTHEEKLKAIVADIKTHHDQGQPVLVGTVSIEKSEEISRRLQRAGIPHEVLNAKQHEREAHIIEAAGQLGKVTIATNMAGRGVDIKLGPQVAQKGGLYVLATERHEARRIDNQLRGRSGRQGDPGASCFYLSLEDDLMRIFGSERISGLMKTLGSTEDEPLTHPMLNRAIASAQKRVEGQNFEMRKHLLEYDDVMNRQRTVVYKIRRRILKGEEIRDEINNRLEDAVETLLGNHVNTNAHPQTWDQDTVSSALKTSFQIDFQIDEETLRNLTAASYLDLVIEKVKERYHQIENVVGSEQLRELERQLLLMVIDNFWREHLYAMDHLRDATRYRGYAQKDPLQEYKKDGLALFQKTMDTISVAVSERLLHIDTGFIEKQREAMLKARQIEEQRKKEMSLQTPPVNSGAGGQSSTPAPQFSAASASGTAGNSNTQAPVAQTGAARPVSAFPGARNTIPKVGRNDPCPCGSGKKYKVCHGKGES